MHHKRLKSVSTNQVISLVNVKKDSIIAAESVKDLIRKALYVHMIHMLHLICISMVTSENQSKDTNECYQETHQCDMNAECTNLHPGYNCTCQAPFHGNGNECYYHDHCWSSPCDEYGSCVPEGPNGFSCLCLESDPQRISDGGVNCVCPPGYKSSLNDTDDCVNKDECKGQRWTIL